jgi:hypothetical protein
VWSFPVNPITKVWGTFLWMTGRLYGTILWLKNCENENRSPQVVKPVIT